MNAVHNVKNKEDFDAKLEEAKKRLVVLHFWAPWAEQCKQMDEVMQELAKQHPNVIFLSLEAEEISEVSLLFEIEAVPTFIFIKNKQKIGRLDGAHAPELTKMVKQHIDTIAPPSASDDPKAELNNRLKSLVNSAPCILFMKGSADQPRCGFSKQMVAILNEHDCSFSTFDILQDDQVRQGLKEFSNWPTYPQLYVNGELLGGLDIVREMAAEDELKDAIPKTSKPKTINDRIKQLLDGSPVLLFMKGGPDRPQCGFSRQIVDILQETGIEYNHFDILTDDDIRQGLKKYSDWPTYPQLYVKGELIGGLDIIKEMSADELKTVLQPDS